MYTLVDDSLIEQLEAKPAAKGDWLFLEPHPEFKGQWKVNCFDAHFFFDFKDVIGSYRAVSPSGLEAFLDVAKRCEYKVAFFEDPGDILKDYEALNEPPDVTLVSPFEDTVNGFLPFQVQGYNMLKDQLAGVARWDTGTGKTVLAGGLIKHHLRLGNFDTAFVVTKATNKVNTERKLRRVAGVESVVVKGLKRKELKSGIFYPRRELYERALDETGKVLILSYETFKVDFDDILPLFEDRRILIVWDEMPTKLKTRTTELYEAVKHLVFKNKGPSVKRKFFRPSWVTQYMLSATPIENSPEDWFNCLRLMNPDIYGTVTEFRNEYVKTYSYFDDTKPETWEKLDKIGMKAAHIAHQVNKSDPGIREQFPEVFEDTFYCEWATPDLKLYNEVLDRCEAADINPLATINLLQMVCDEPTLLWNRAEVYEAYETAFEEWEEIGEGREPKPEGSKAAIEVLQGLTPPVCEHGKQAGLRYLLEKHYGEKTLVFSQLNNSLMPTLERRLEEWGVTYVRYNGTEKQRQAAEDTFMEDPNIMVFLTSDMGSDSLDLYMGRNVINYNLPWKWTTKTQRANRIHRVISEFEWNNVYTLVYSQSVEERKGEIIDIKRGYHDGVFKGKMGEASASARLTREDLYYMLRGYSGTV